MKKITSFLVAAGFILTAGAQVKMPAPSPTQTIKQDFGTASIELKYSRPSAKGRKVFGDLVPYGKLWRTGANGATTIRFNEPVMIGGKTIDTGNYALYSIPDADNWQIILNKGTDNWGVDGYKETDDVVRVTVASSRVKSKVETFTMQFTDLKAQSCALQINWEKTSVSLPIMVNITDKIRAQIEEALKGEKKPYWQAAQFYKEYDNNLPKALENATKATEANPKAFWIWLYKARIQLEMGDNAGAMESSKRSLELATQEKNDDYIKMNQDLQKKLK